MKDHNAISGTIVDAAFHIHRALGPGVLESVDEAVLARELERRGLKVERQKPVPSSSRKCSLRRDFGQT